MRRDKSVIYIDNLVKSQEENNIYRYSTLKEETVGFAEVVQLARAS